MDPTLTAKSRLHGVTIFLSASIPTRERSDEYKRIPEAPQQIEEAVVCIARAIFMEGGTLVFGAHPSISPLVARVVDHYYLPAAAEELPRERGPERDDSQWQNPSLVIYQSRVWEKYWAEATERLTRHPLVRVIWIDAEPGETVNLEIKDRAQAPKSMKKMRESMIEQTSPVAMIAIGGMRGVFDEARIFAKLRPSQPIFTLGTTGGAAALLPENPEYGNRTRVVDRGVEDLVRRFWGQQREREPGKHEAAESREAFYVPYAFIAHRIVTDIVEHSEWHKDRQP